MMLSPVARFARFEITARRIMLSECAGLVSEVVVFPDVIDAFPLVGDRSVVALSV
jgi:hypothetical protein